MLLKLFMLLLIATPVIAQFPVLKADSAAAGAGAGTVAPVAHHLEEAMRALNTLASEALTDDPAGESKILFEHMRGFEIINTVVCDYKKALKDDDTAAHDEVDKIAESARFKQSCIVQNFITSFLAKTTDKTRHAVFVNSAHYDNGYTSLMFAAVYNQPVIANMLIGLGADVNAENNDPAPIRTRSGNSSMTAFTQLPGTNPYPGTNESHLPYTGFRIGGSCALIIAALYNSAALVELLLNHKANPHAIDKFSQFTALHSAVRNGNPRTVSLLLAHGANPNHHANFDSITPLMFAVSFDPTALEVMKILLAAGANPNIYTNAPFFQRSVLLEVLQQYRMSASWLNKLIKKGDPTAADDLRATIEHVKKIIALLIEHDADLDYCPYDPDWSYLRIAQERYPECAEIMQTALARRPWYGYW